MMMMMLTIRRGVLWNAKFGHRLLTSTCTDDAASVAACYDQSYVNIRHAPEEFDVTSSGKLKCVNDANTVDM
jgi:hypothetical protein